MRIKIFKKRVFLLTLSVIVMVVAGFSFLVFQEDTPVEAATPTIELRSTSVSDGTSHSVTLPSGITTGDLLIVFASIDGQPTVTWQTGWTEMFTVFADASHRFSAAYLQATSTITNVDFTTSVNERSAHISYRISGAEDVGTQPPQWDTAVVAGTSPDPPPLSPTGGAKDYLWIAAEGNDDDNDTATGFPTNYTDTVTLGSGGGGFGAAIAAGVRSLNAATEDPSNFTIAAEGAAAATVAVHPQSAGPRAADTPSVKVASRTGSAQTWNSSSWTNRKKITINKDKVVGTAGHTNFPMLFSVTDPDLRSTGNGGKVASSTAGDIFFEDWEGNKIDHEIDTYTASTGSLIAWVEVPFISSTSTRTLYIYYGNASATYQPTNAATWNANYTGVWHLGDGDSTASGFYKDSKSTNNGTLTDADGDSVQAAGQIGNAFNFNGDADTIQFGTGPLPTLSSPWTMSAWALLDTAGTFPGIVSFYDSAVSNEHVEIGVNSGSSQIKIITGGETPGEGSRMATSTLNYLSMIYNGTQMCIYLNGQGDYCVTPSGSSWQSSTDMQIARAGRSAVGFTPWDGIIDEVRVSNIERGASWIQTEYNNQKFPQSFYSYGGQEAENRQDSSGNPAPAVKLRGGVKFRFDAILRRAWFLMNSAFR